MLIFTMLSVILITLTIALDEKYTTKYDNIDIDSLLKNERLLQKYVHCLLDLVACTVDGLELKKNMPDAIQSDCSKCSKRQKEGSDKLITYLINHKPDYWELLGKKYDPSGEYTKKFMESTGIKKNVSVS